MPDIYLFDIISAINSPELQARLLLLKILFGGVGIFFILVLVYLVMRYPWFKLRMGDDLREFITFTPFGLRPRVKRWKKIRNRLESGMESEYKLAILEADKMMEEILKRMDVEGDTVGIQLENVPRAIAPHLEELRRAHQTRSNLAHDPDYRLTLEEAKLTLDQYELTLRDLDVI